MWEFVVQIYNIVFYEPLLNGLIFLIDIAPLRDVGVAVIVLTIIVKFIIFPFQHRASITQRKMRELEPDLKKIKERYKEDTQEQTKKIMELYRQHGVNPFSGFVIILIQIPVFVALYKIFITGINFDYSHIYSFVRVPENIKVNFLGLIDMTQKSSILAALAGITQFFQMKLAIPSIKKQNQVKKSLRDNLAQSINIQARYIMPTLVFFIALKFSSAMALYWTTMNIFAIVHEVIIKKKAEKITRQTNGKTTGNNKITDRTDTTENVGERMG